MNQVPTCYVASLLPQFQKPLSIVFDGTPVLSVESSFFNRYRGLQVPRLGGFLPAGVGFSDGSAVKLLVL